MSCNHLEDQIDDYVDDSLAESRRRDIDRHLETCPGCREKVEELRELLRATAELPRGIEPGRDLLPGIRSAVERDDGAGASGPGRKIGNLAWYGWAGLAASLIVVLAAALAMVLLGERPGSSPAPQGGGVLPAAFEGGDPLRVAESDYVEATNLLLAAIEERRDQLSPETLEVLEENLAIIDRAIHEVRQALDSSPGDSGDELVLRAMYGKRVELLRRASQLSS